MTQKLLRRENKRDYYHSKKDNVNKRKWRNKANCLLHRAKKQHVEKLIKENTDKKDNIWKVLREIQPRNEKVIPAKIIKTDQANTQEKLNETKLISNELNKFFTNIPAQLQQNYPLLSCAQSEEPHKCLKEFVADKVPGNCYFQIPKISAQTVYNHLIKLNVKKSTGPDLISPKFLKMTAGIITEPLTYIINLSISNGQFPEKWKLAKVIPIYKTGDPELCENYRPISILCTLSKIIERHIHDHLYSFFNKYKLLCDNQSGFRAHHSCQTALTKIIETWLSSIDEGKFVGCAKLDFRKAFDTINHQIILDKLKIYKFSNLSLKWIDSYLNNRQQMVYLDGHMSDPLTVLAGVPQGSILGPLIFIIYVNDLLLCKLSSKIDLYADDTTIYSDATTIKELETILCKDLKVIEEWCYINKMYIHENKSTVMCLATNNKHINYKSNLNITLNNNILKQVKEDKLLGLTMNQTLNWENHINEVCKKVMQKLGILHQNKHILSKDLKILFYNAYILPHFDYCLTIWGNANANQIDRIYKLQKQAARLILNEHYLTPTTVLFERLNWISIQDRIILHKATFMYKIIYHLCPDYLHNLFKYTSEITKKTLRSVHNNDLYIPRPNSKYLKQSLQYTGPKIWNSLPLDLRSSNTVTVFKNKLYHSITHKNP